MSSLTNDTWLQEELNLKNKKYGSQRYISGSSTQGEACGESHLVPGV